MVLSSKYLDGETLSWTAVKERGVKCAVTLELARPKKARRMKSFGGLDSYLSLISTPITMLGSLSSYHNGARSVVVGTSDYTSELTNG